MYHLPCWAFHQKLKFNHHDIIQVSKFQATVDFAIPNLLARSSTMRFRLVSSTQEGIHPAGSFCTRCSLPRNVDDKSKYTEKVPRFVVQCRIMFCITFFHYCHTGLCGIASFRSTDGVCLGTGIKIPRCWCLS